MIPTELEKYDLSGYITDGKPEPVTSGDKSYIVQRYQGEHKDEYTVMEVENGVPNGLAQLFDNGVIQMSWRMVDGQRRGRLTVYENGVVSRMTTWNSLDQMSLKKNGDEEDAFVREVLNDKSGKRLLIERNVKTNVIVYKGEYNHSDLTKEGFGIEYDVESGIEKYSGCFRNDQLFHIRQSFVKPKKMKEGDNELMMIEFGGNEDEENNRTILNRHPIYMGGYRFDQKRNEFIRCGLGYELNEFSGICDCIGEWNENGEKKEGSGCKLYGGWYGEGEFDQSIRLSEIEKGIRKRREEEEERRMHEIVPICSQFNLNQIRGIEEFVIGNNSMNGDSGNTSELKLELTDFPRLKRIEIGSNCFQNVRRFVLTNLLNLHDVKIGEECFRIKNSWSSSNERSDGIFRLRNCPNLSKVELGDNSFCEFKYFDISELNSLHSIDFGKNCFWFSDFCLKGEYY